ncbi:hypothetical protein ACFP4H_19255 [Pseudophaeobacter arcticus]
MMTSGMQIDATFRSIARLTKKWPGRAVGPHGVARYLNSGGTLPPILWFFNAEQEPVNFHAALNPEQQFVALRSLNLIMKPSLERDEVGAKMAGHLADALTGMLPRDIALVGGNCQGAPYAICLAQRLMDLGHDIKSVAAIDTIPDRAITVPALLNFGVEAPERNPFMQDQYVTQKRVENLFPAYEQASLPCGHGQYFRAENLPYLIANIENFIGTRIRAEEHL